MCKYYKYNYYVVESHSIHGRYCSSKFQTEIHVAIACYGLDERLVTGITDGDHSGSTDSTGTVCGDNAFSLGGKCHSVQHDFMDKVNNWELHLQDKKKLHL